jgi:hypothetical protein
MNKQIINQLLIIRSAVDTALDVLLPEQNECTHPLEARIEYSTMGHEEWECRKCGLHYKESES